VRHELVSQSGSTVRGIYVKLLGLDRSLPSTPLSASLPVHWNFRLWPINGDLPVLPAVKPFRSRASGGFRQGSRLRLSLPIVL
jgi:hypothetical protein